MSEILDIKIIQHSTFKAINVLRQILNLNYDGIN